MFIYAIRSRLGSGASPFVRSFTRLPLYALLAVGLIGSAVAQDQTGPLVGNWEFRKVSMHVVFKLASDENGEAVPDRQYAVITRSDWSPHRVGKVLYKNVVNVGKKRWRAEEIDDKGNARTVRIRLKSDGKLHTKSYLDGQQDIQWTSNES